MSADTPRRRRKEARPAEVLAAALDVFVERGFAATRLDEIATRAGISKGTLYLYYENKEALFRAVVEHAILPLLDEGDAMLARGRDDPARLLREMIERWWNEVGNTKLAGIPKLVMAEAANFPAVSQFYFDNVISRGRHLLSAVLQLGVERGVFRPIAPELACQVMLAPVLMANIWRQSLSVCEPKALDWDAYITTHLDIVMNGLLPREQIDARATAEHGGAKS